MQHWRANYKNNYSYKTRHLTRYISDAGFNINSYLSGNAKEGSSAYKVAKDCGDVGIKVKKWKDA